MKLIRFATAGALVLGLAFWTGCASVRSTALSWSNDNMRGQAAPALDSGDWVAADFWVSPEEPQTDWRMLVVFKPT